SRVPSAVRRPRPAGAAEVLTCDVSAVRARPPGPNVPPGGAVRPRRRRSREVVTFARAGRRRPGGHWDQEHSRGKEMITMLPIRPLVASAMVATSTGLLAVPVQATAQSAVQQAVPPVLTGIRAAHHPGLDRLVFE